MKSLSMKLGGTKSLSKMSGNQASGLKELERRYEEILDENCRVFAEYFKAVLDGGGDGDRVPTVVINVEEDELSRGDGWIQTQLLGFQNGRYNVMLVLFLSLFSVNSYIYFVLTGFSSCERDLIVYAFFSG